MEYKKNRFLSEVQNTMSTAVTYHYSSGIYYHSADWYTVITIIMLPWSFYLTAMTDLINFIGVTCKIWRKIGLGHETSFVSGWDRDIDSFRRDETEMRHWYASRPSRDQDVETETTTLVGRLQEELATATNWTSCHIKDFWLAATLRG